MVSFYSDAELMHKLASNRNFNIMVEIAGWTLLFSLQRKQFFYKTLAFYNTPKTRLYTTTPTLGILNTKKFKFTNYEGFILDRPRLHGEELELLAMSSLIRSPNYLPQILSVHIYMTTPLVYACPCKVGNC